MAPVCLESRNIQHTTLSKRVASLHWDVSIQLSNAKCRVTDNWEVIWKEEIVTWLRFWLGICIYVLNKTTAILGQISTCLL